MTEKEKKERLLIRDLHNELLGLETILIQATRSHAKTLGYVEQIKKLLQSHYSVPLG